MAFGWIGSTIAFGEAIVFQKPLFRMLKDQGGRAEYPGGDRRRFVGI
jgi:hypothetical protein